MNTHLKRLLVFTGIFMICVPVGTLSHEYGHIAVAAWQGHPTTLHYASMNWEKSYQEDINQIDALYTSREEKQKAYRDYGRKVRRESLWVRMGGPLQTMLTGTIGLVLLLFRKKRIYAKGMKVPDWIAVFLSLFWMREIYNLSLGIGRGIMNKNFFSSRQWDENVINMYFNLPGGTIPIVLACLGLLVVLYVIFRIIPKEYRLVFISSGFIGGILGAYLWLSFVGPVVLP